MCSATYKLAAVFSERMVGNSPKSSWYDFSPIKDAWGFGDLPAIQTQLLNQEQFPSVLGSEQASLQLCIHSADICAFHTEPALSCPWMSAVSSGSQDHKGRPFSGAWPSAEPKACGPLASLSLLVLILRDGLRLHTLDFQQLG